MVKEHKAKISALLAMYIVSSLKEAILGLELLLP